MSIHKIRSSVPRLEVFLAGTCVLPVVAVEAIAEAAPAQPTILAQMDDAAASPAFREPGQTEPAFVTRCSAINPGGREAVMYLGTPPAANARRRIDITAFRDGFEAGRFETVATVAADENVVEWEGGEPGISYRWRVVETTADGRSETIASGRIDPPVCPVDFQREAEGTEPIE